MRSFYRRPRNNGLQLTADNMLLQQSFFFSVDAIRAAAETQRYRASLFENH
jgi:hypothetical protein